MVVTICDYWPGHSYIITGAIPWATSYSTCILYGEISAPLLFPGLSDFQYSNIHVDYITNSDKYYCTKYITHSEVALALSVRSSIFLSFNFITCMYGEWAVVYPGDRNDGQTSLYLYFLVFLHTATTFSLYINHSSQLWTGSCSRFTVLLSIRCKKYLLSFWVLIESIHLEMLVVILIIAAIILTIGISHLLRAGELLEWWNNNSYE